MILRIVHVQVHMPQYIGEGRQDDEAEIPRRLDAAGTSIKSHAVNVVLTGDGFELSQPERGDTIDELLRYVHFDTEAMKQAYRDRIAAADLDDERRRAFIEELEAGLVGYTYLED